MGYDFYFDKVLLPVPPSKIEIKIKNQNKTINLISDGECNILKDPGLTEISFSLLIPQVKYAFAKYKSGFESADKFLSVFETLKVSKKPFRFIVSRAFPGGKALFDTNMQVSLEEYKIAEEAGNGLDLNVSISLKQYKAYSTKTIQFNTSANSAASSQKTRDADSSKIGIGSRVIVSGRLHRDSYGKGPGKTLTNYDGKINFINLKGSHPYHVTTPSGSHLGWVTRTSVKGG